MDSEQAVNITWNDPDKSNQLLQYYLTIMNTINQQWTFKLQDPNYVFTAPEGAPPCEVYNFSVTVTYVGATYTEAGCSISNPVLSTMLPSLPDIMSDTIHYHLVKLFRSQGITLIISFEVSYQHQYAFTAGSNHSVTY